MTGNYQVVICVLSYLSVTIFYFIYKQVLGRTFKCFPCTESFCQKFMFYVGTTFSECLLAVTEETATDFPENISCEMSFSFLLLVHSLLKVQQLISSLI